MLEILEVFKRLKREKRFLDRAKHNVLHYEEKAYRYMQILFDVRREHAVKEILKDIVIRKNRTTEINNN